MARGQPVAGVRAEGGSRDGLCNRGRWGGGEAGPWRAAPRTKDRPETWTRPWRPLSPVIQAGPPCGSPAACHLSACLSASLTSASLPCLFMPISLYLSVFPSPNALRPSAYSSAYLIFLSICPMVCLLVHPSFSLPICLLFASLPASAFDNPCDCPFI